MTKVVIERYNDTRTRVLLDGKEVKVNAYEIKQSVDEAVSVALTFPHCEVEIRRVDE